MDLPTIVAFINSLKQEDYLTEQSDAVFINNMSLSHTTNSIVPGEIVKIQKSGQNARPICEVV